MSPPFSGIGVKKLHPVVPHQVFSTAHQQDVIGEFNQRVVDLTVQSQDFREEPSAQNLVGV